MSSQKWSVIVQKSTHFLQQQCFSVSYKHTVAPCRDFQRKVNSEEQHANQIFGSKGAHMQTLSLFLLQCPVIIKKW